MFAAPIAAGRAHPALHFIEDEEDFIFVADAPKRLQPFTAKMVIPALALDRLNDDGADVDLAFINKFSDLTFRFLFAVDYVAFLLRFGQSEVDARARNPWPIELGEQIRFARIRVRQAHGVTRAPVKGVTEMQNLSIALAITGAHVLAHLPIHRCLQAIFDRERAAFNEQVALERPEANDPRKSFYKFRVAFRVNI